MSKAQEKIAQHLKDGAKLDCTEGKNYKSWLVLKNGTTVKIQTRSAEIVCREFFDKLNFTQSGIYWKL